MIALKMTVKMKNVRTTVRNRKVLGLELAVLVLIVPLVGVKVTMKETVKTVLMATKMDKRSSGRRVGIFLTTRISFCPSLLRRLHCPVLENEWENGESKGRDSGAYQISTRC